MRAAIRHRIRLTLSRQRRAARARRLARAPRRLWRLYSSDEAAVLGALLAFGLIAITLSFSLLVHPV